MRKLEAEKTCLVLEAERQSEQYEKCLDDITSQVLQAVMAQRVSGDAADIIFRRSEEYTKLYALVDINQEDGTYYIKHYIV